MDAKKKKFIIQEKEIRQCCREMLEMLAVDVDEEEIVKTLSFSEKLLVEIAKALYCDAKILIFDDILNLLSADLLDKFESIFLALNSLHISNILIDSGIHNLKRYCTRLFVMREGMTVSVLPKREMDENHVISLMLGNRVMEKESEGVFLDRKVYNLLCEIKCISITNILSGVDLRIYKEEAVGILNINKQAGQAIQSLFRGEMWPDSGEVYLEGKKVSFTSPEAAVAQGISAMAEEAVFYPNLSWEENIMLPALELNSHVAGIIAESELKYYAHELMTEYILPSTGIVVSEEDIRYSRILKKKISLCRALSTKPRLVVMSNPAQGLDVNLKERMYKDIRSLKKRHTAVLIISSDIGELFSICERIYVISKDGVEFSILNTEKNREKLLHIYGEYLKDM